MNRFYPLLARSLLAVLLLASPLSGTAAIQEPPPEAAATGEPQAVDSAYVLPPELVRQSEQMEQLLAIYARIPGLRDVELHLDRGILVLAGSVLSVEERDRVVEMAQLVFPDVLFVDSRELLVETDLRKRLSPAAERIQEKVVAFLRFLPAFLLGLFMVGLAALLAAWVGSLEWIFGRPTTNPFARNLLRQVVRAVIVLVALLLALDLMGVTTLVGALLGAAGVVGIAVGFAFRDIVENYLAGILLSLRQPFAPNDHVQLAGEEGRVIRLTGRETVLMTLEGNHVRIPNGTVFKAVITNLTRNPRRSFHFMVGIGPNQPLGRAIAVGNDALTGVTGVLETPPPAVRVHELTGSGVTLRISGWVDQGETDFLKARSQAIRAVKEAFEASGLITPPPEFGVHILSGEDGAPALPSPQRTSDPPPGGAEPEGDEPDMSPDTTIEEEIARELKVSDEENYLE